MNVTYWLDYIMNHFESQFPRTISTLATQNRQVEVFSKEEALQYFKESDYVDCRISAFGQYEIEKEKPNLIFVDLDQKNALHEVLALFYKTIHGIPLVLNTGNGYAMIQPIQIKPMQKITLDEKLIFDVPKKFLLFAERYLTNSKCDMGNHPSLKSCLIRIPETYNSKLLDRKSKENSKVTIVSEWNRVRVDVKNLPFMDYLRNQQRRMMRRNLKYDNSYLSEIPYIENILKNKIIDGRKRIFALVLCPYLINVKKLSIEESEKILQDYFDGYISDYSIRYKLNEVMKKGIFPYSLKNMQQNDPELYDILGV